MVVRHRNRLRRLADLLRPPDVAVTIAVVWVDADGVTVAEVPPEPAPGTIDYRRGLIGDDMTSPGGILQLEG